MKSLQIFRKSILGLEMLKNEVFSCNFVFGGLHIPQLNTNSVFRMNGEDPGMSRHKLISPFVLEVRFYSIIGYGGHQKQNCKKTLHF